MYLALQSSNQLGEPFCHVGVDAPFGRIPLLLHLREDALGLVVLAVRACRHLAVTLDLLLPAHVARLYTKLSASKSRLQQQLLGSLVRFVAA